MSGMTDVEAKGTTFTPDVSYYKGIVSKALLFKAVHKTARPIVPAFLANVAAYTVALISQTYGKAFNHERVWTRQGISPQLVKQIEIWAREINDRLHETANGRMISEWAKRPECLEVMFSRPFSSPLADIPETL
jgi:hypothetical protein